MIRRTLILSVALLGAALSQAQAGVSVLLAAAGDAELRPVLTRLSATKEERVAAWTFWSGTLDGVSVVVIRTESDPVNAAAAATLAIRRFQPDRVISFGTARAHDPALGAGRVVVADTFVPFDGMVSEHRELSTGSVSAEWKRLPHLFMTSGERETPMLKVSAAAADATALVAVAERAAPGRVVQGALGSAPQVNREADRIARVRSLWGTTCEDGDSAYVAGVAQLFGLPVVGVRVLVADGTLSPDASVLAAEIAMGGLRK